MPVGRDLADRVGHQRDVVARQRARPHAVVAQQALGARRVGRDHVREQVGPVGELRSRYGVSIVRMKSLIALTEPFAVSQSGSTRTPGSAPSPIRQKIQKRFHSLYVGTCA